MKFSVVIVIMAFAQASYAHDCQKYGSIGSATNLWIIEDEYKQSEVLKTAIAQKESELNVTCDEGVTNLTTMPFYSRVTYTMNCAGAKFTIKSSFKAPLCVPAEFKIVSIKENL